MIEILLGAAAAIPVSYAAYAFGKAASSDSEGCNGHHWMEPYSADIATPDERVSAGLENTNRIRRHSARARNHQVDLYEQKIKKCQDCGKVESVRTHVGRASFSEFESGDE